jgi:hypothetical protein
MMFLSNAIFNKGLSIMKNIWVGLFFIIFSLNMAFAKQMQLNKSTMPQVVSEKAATGSMQETITPLSQEELAKKKGLLIFLDDSEKDKGGFVNSNLLTALYQEACPIVASTSLMYALLGQGAKNSWCNKAAQVWENIIDPHRWIIKKINNLVCLLIPVSYLDSLHIDKNKVKENGYPVSELSDFELQLGLKVNHMETIDSQTISAPGNQNIYQYVSSYFFKPSMSVLGDYFTDALDTVFCKRSDYKDRKIEVPVWVMYIHGHGGMNYSIANLSFGGFKNLLYFLDKKINTQLLVVSSCYAAGAHMNAMYGEIKRETQEYYSFPIIIQGLNDLMVFAYRPFIDSATWYYEKKMKLITHINFNAFLKKSKELEADYNEIMQSISLDIIENTPQLKLPGIEWFSVLDADKKIVSIGSILAQTRDPQKPLDVINFFKKDPEIILLYTDTIPFELKINLSNPYATIISMVSTELDKLVPVVYTMQDILSQRNVMKPLYWLKNKVKAVVSTVSTRLMEYDPVRVIHRIKKISSTQGIGQIVHWFRPVAYSNGTKWFFIEEIGDNKDVLILGTPEEETRVYFKNKDNILFTERFAQGNRVNFEKVESGSVHEKFYQERIRIIQEYPQLSAAAKEARQEISSEQIKKIENVLIKQREKQKALASKNSQQVQ